MVAVYSKLKWFPKESEQPSYYKMLAQIGDLTLKPETELIVAITIEGILLGVVVYFNDMQHYGSGGIVTQEKNGSGFRLLAVSNSSRGTEVGKSLSQKCIDKAKENK
jgi:predicted N-acetyltransferase YhbS